MNLNSYRPYSSLMFSFSLSFFFLIFFPPDYDHSFTIKCRESRSERMSPQK